MSTVKKHKTKKKAGRKKKAKCKKVVISWQRKLIEDFQRAKRDAARTNFSKIFIGV